MWRSCQRPAEEALPFLRSSDGEPPSSFTTTSSPAKYPRNLLFSFAVSIQIIVGFIYVVFALQYLPSYVHVESYHSDVVLPNSFQTQFQRFLTSETSPFAGRPSTRLDRAWSHLLHGTNIRMSEEELARRNQTSVALPEGGGHLAWLEVNHQLHCVKWLRQWIYRDHYHPNLTKDEVGHRMLHADHCLELLRQAVMCKFDTAIVTFEWQANETKPMLRLQGPEHECVDWDSLKAATAARIVDDEEMERLVNPMQDQL